MDRLTITGAAPAGPPTARAGAGAANGDTFQVGCHAWVRLPKAPSGAEGQAWRCQTDHHLKPCGHVNGRRSHACTKTQAWHPPASATHRVAIRLWRLATPPDDRYTLVVPHNRGGRRAGPDYVETDRHHRRGRRGVGGVAAVQPMAAAADEGVGLRGGRRDPAGLARRRAGAQGAGGGGRRRQGRPAAHRVWSRSTSSSRAPGPRPNWRPDRPTTTN